MAPGEVLHQPTIWLSRRMATVSLEATLGPTADIAGASQNESSLGQEAVSVAVGARLLDRLEVGS